MSFKHHDGAHSLRHCKARHTLPEEMLKAGARDAIVNIAYRSALHGTA